MSTLWITIPRSGPISPSADILLTFAPRLTDDVLRAGTRLKWVQALGTGVDNLIDRPVLRKDIIVTNVHGIHGAPVSEAAIGSMLALARDIPRAVRAQDRREWARFPAQLLHNKTVGIFGIGAIAEELAPKCKAFGMRTVGISFLAADGCGLRPHACERRACRGRRRIRFLRAAHSAYRKNPQQRRRESARGDEAEKLPGQSCARRRCRRGGPARGAEIRPDWRSRPGRF